MLKDFVESETGFFPARSVPIIQGLSAQRKATSLNHARFSLTLCQLFLNGSMSACTCVCTQSHMCVCVRVYVCNMLGRNKDGIRFCLA